MNVVWGHPDLVVPFVMERIGLTRPFGHCQTAAVVSNDHKVAAGLVFHNWDPEHGVIEVSAAAIDPRWAQRGVLKEAFGYIFERAKCQLAVCRCHPKNKAVRRLWKSFGADEYIIPRMRGRDAGECILTVTDDAWRASKFMR